MSRKRGRGRDRKRERKEEADPGQVELLPEMVRPGDEREESGDEAADQQSGPADRQSGPTDQQSGRADRREDGPDDPEWADQDAPDPGVLSAPAGRDEEVEEAATVDPSDGESPAASRPAGNQLARARDLVQSGRVKDAVELYRDILMDNPTNMKAHNNLGVLFDELGEHETAVQHFEAALDVEHDNVEVLTNYGSALTELARYAWAAEVLHKAERLAPGEHRTRLAMGVLAFRRGLYEEAEAGLRSVCDRMADHGLAHYYRGEALNRLGRFDEAAEVMARAAELLPDDPRPAYTLGHLYDRQNLRAEAARMYRRARDLQAEAT